MQNDIVFSKFPIKLEYILESEEFHHIIRWSKNKTCIDILNLEKMEKEILMTYFRHRRFSSFIRQLNLYGFSKIKASGHYRYSHQQLKQGKKLSNILSKKNLQIMEQQTLGLRNIELDEVSIPSNEEFTVRNHQLPPIAIIPNSSVSTQTEPSKEETKIVYVPVYIPYQSAQPQQYHPECYWFSL